MLLITAVLLRTPRAQPPSDRVINAQTVRAADFQLVGSDGKMYGSITSNGGRMPMIYLTDGNGRTRASLMLPDDGRAVLQLADRHGNLRFVAQTNSDDEAPNLMMVDPKGTGRIDLTMVGGARPRLEMKNNGSTTQVRLGVDDYKTASLDLTDYTGKRRASLNVGSGGAASPSFTLAGKDSAAQLEVLCWDTRVASLFLRSPDGKKSVSFGGDVDEAKSH
jgi:hypothetical protein